MFLTTSNKSSSRGAKLPWKHTVAKQQRKQLSVSRFSLDTSIHPGVIKLLVTFQLNFTAICARTRRIPRSDTHLVLHGFFTQGLVFVVMPHPTRFVPVTPACFDVLRVDFLLYLPLVLELLVKVTYWYLQIDHVHYYLLREHYLSVVNKYHFIVEYHLCKFLKVGVKIIRLKILIMLI